MDLVGVSLAQFRRSETSQREDDPPGSSPAQVPALPLAALAAAIAAVAALRER